MPKVADYKGYEIWYDSKLKKFTADVQGNSLEATTETELESLIDRTLKNSGLFPIQVIRCSGHHVEYGRITSYNPTDRRGWFVSNDGNRQKLWGFDGYYLDTGTNRMTCEQIKVKVAQINQLDTEISTLQKGLETPFLEHWKTISGIP